LLVQGSGFQVQGSGFRDQGSAPGRRVGVWGLGFRVDHDLCAIGVSLSNLSRDSTNETADSKFTETYTWLKQTQERLNEFKKCGKGLRFVHELNWDIVTALELSESADE